MGTQSQPSKRKIIATLIKCFNADWCTTSDGLNFQEGEFN